jgi:hypothetical protein
MCPGEIPQAHARCHLIVGAHVRPQRVRVLLVRFTITCRVVLRPDDVEAAVRLTKIERDFVALAEKMAHRGDLLAENLADRSVDRRHVEVVGEGNAQ